MQTTTPLAPAPGIRFPALRHPSFRLYMATTGIHMFADNTEHVLAYWVLWDLTRSPFWLGYAVFSHWAPWLFLSLHAGYLADRYDKRRLQQIAAVMYVFSSSSVGLMLLTDTANVWAIAGVLLIHGIAGVIAGPSGQVLINRLVGQEDLMSGIAIHSSTRHAAQFVGPAFGGLLLLLLGPGPAYLVNALFHLPYLVGLGLLPSSEQTSERRRPEQSWAAVREGMTYLTGNSTLFAVTLATAAPSLIVGASYQALMPIFAEKFEVGQLGYSALLSAHGLGAIVGGIGVGWVGSLHHRGPLVILTGVMWGGLMAAFSLSSAFFPALVLLLLMGVSAVAFSSVAQTLVQTETPRAVQGRVVGAYLFFSHGSRTVSGLMVGTLALLIGSSAAVALGGTAIMLCVAAAAAASRGLRELD